MLMLLVILILGLSVLVSLAYWSVKLGISPMPTSPKAKKALMELLPDEVSGKVYELGCGWGGLAAALAQRYPDHEVVGVELSPIPYWFCKARFWLFPMANLTVRRVDFFEVPLADAGLIVCYLYPGAMHRLKEKFAEELASGTWIASNTFALPFSTPVKSIELSDIYRTKVYLYRR
jgi:hypothetical protein